MQLSDRRVDLVRQQVLHADGSTTALTTREAQLMAYLTERAEVDVSRDELLDQVWEYRATYATRAVDVAMRRLRSKVEPDPSAPVHLISVHGVGYRFVPPPDDVTAHFVTPAPPPARTTNLRSDRSPFFGREAELTRLGELFTSGARLISILGPGGIGKTRLALAAARLALQASDGVWVVDLTDARGIDGILSAVGKTLSVPLVQGEDPDSLVEFVGRALAARGRQFVVFDNVEQLVDVAPATIGRWLSMAPLTRLLITSRERLRIQGEQTIELMPLSGHAARELFFDRARAVGAEFGPADAEMVDRIIHKLDGLPLAIELAAPRARVLSLEQLLDRLARRFKVLSTHQPSGPSRQSTLRHAIDWSWDLLTEHERLALAQCSAFVGGFSLESAEVVIQVPDDAPWTLDLVEALRDKSLLRVVEPDDLPGEVRFGMYESIREYAAERLAEAGLEAATQDRHAEHVLSYTLTLAGRVETHGGLASFLQLAVEFDNLLAIHDRRATSHPLQSLQAVIALGPVLRVRGPNSLYKRLLEDALAVARPLGDRDTLARLLLDRALLRRVSGHVDDARRDVGEALVLVRESQTELEVDALSLLGMINSDQSRIDEAEVIVQTALTLAEELEFTRLRGVLTSQLGTYAMVRGHTDESETLYLEAIRLQNEAGHERGSAATMANLGMLYAEFGRLEEAEAYTLKGLRVHQAWGDRRGRATILAALAGLSVRRDDMAQALTYTEEALTAFDDVGYARMAAVAKANLASIHWALDEREHVVRDLLEVVEAHRGTGDRVLEAMAQSYLAAFLASANDLEGARRAMAAADACLQGLYVRQAAGVQLVARGFLELAEARQSTDPLAIDRLVQGASEKAEHGCTSSILGIQFIARLLRRELGAS